MTLRRGVTLIELVVTLALLGLMAAMALPLAELTLQRSREAQLREALREIRVALDRYRSAADQGQIERRVGDSGYPSDLNLLVEGVPNVRSPKRERLYFLRRVPRDPFAPAELPAAATWGLRSYASAPDSPSAGSDVFDIYSRAEGVGLNGLPYREW
ncbi:MAG: type II secretion system protein [Rubrivivax sp.]|nr:type II secretion system protein [Rubrivivax sp.]